MLERSGVPSIAVAIVRNGKLELARAWGAARLTPLAAAEPNTRYGIGSISKQFTAAAVLLLQQQRRLSLDDRVAQFLPALPGADAVTIRQLLTHTAGYIDFWPQKYLPVLMLRPTEVDALVRDWAGRPRSFASGTKWQYSNTNYAIAGAIVERVTGLPLFEFMRRHIFTPLGMSSVVDLAAEQPAGFAATEYSRYALAPLYAVAPAARGWLYASGGLAMTAADLARWDIALLDQRLLDSASSRDMETATRLADGRAIPYGLGVELQPVLGRRALWHGGGTAGFTAMNYVFPNERIAVMVLTNEQPSAAAPTIAVEILRLVFAREPAVAAGAKAEPIAMPAPPPSAAGAALQCADPGRDIRSLVESLQRGSIDRARFSDNANTYFSTAALQAYASSLASQGAVKSVFRSFQEERAGMLECAYHAVLERRSVSISTLQLPDGRFEQFMVFAALPFGGK
jgi:CubicO group peptidase (beta-lactamase class C family)